MKVSNAVPEISEVDGMTVKIDYLTMTVHGEDCDPVSFYNAFLGDKLGELEQQPYSQRMYKSVWSNTFVRLYMLPLMPDKEGRDHFSIEIKGEGCSCLTPDDFRSIHAAVMGGVCITFSRIDLAFDHVPFTPRQLYDAIESEIDGGSIYWHGRRTSLKWIEDGGKEGFTTLYIGKRTSNRFVRCYDKHGFTRFETEYKAEWAQKVAMKIMSCNYQEWFDLYRSMVRSYLDLPEGYFWWHTFLKEVKQSDLHVYSARNLETQRIVNWVRKQVSPSLFAIVAIEGVDFLMGIVKDGSKRGLSKYQRLIQAHSEEKINQILEEVDNEDYWQGDCNECLQD